MAERFSQKDSYQMFEGYRLLICPAPTYKTHLAAFQISCISFFFFAFSCCCDCCLQLILFTFILILLFLWLLSCWFQDNCPREKFPPNPEPNSHPNPDGRKIFLGGNFPDTCFFYEFGFRFVKLLSSTLPQVYNFVINRRS